MKRSITVLLSPPVGEAGRDSESVRTHAIRAALKGPRSGRLKFAVDSADIYPMDPSAIALAGLRQASAQFDQAAARITGCGSAGEATDVVSLSEEMVALMSATLMFEANAATMKVVQDVNKAVVDVTA